MVDFLGTCGTSDMHGHQHKPAWVTPRDDALVREFGDWERLRGQPNLVSARELLKRCAKNDTGVLRKQVSWQATGCEA